MEFGQDCLLYINQSLITTNTYEFMSLHPPPTPSTQTAFTPVDLDSNHKASVKFTKTILIIFEMHYFGFASTKVKSLMFRKDFKSLKIQSRFKYHTFIM